MNGQQQSKPQGGVFDLKHGYPKGCLLPTLTVVTGVFICAFAVRHFCIDGTVFDNRHPPTDPDTYYHARRDYNDGNLASAASQAGKILSKQPNHAEADQLMARIALARGNPQRALEHLRQSLDTALDRDEVAKWISAIEVSQPK